MIVPASKQTDRPVPGSARMQPPPIVAGATADVTASQAASDSTGIQDWDDLFRVIRTRLGEADDDALAGSPRRWSGNGQSRVSPELLQCVAALHLLHPTVMRELGRLDQLECAVVDAHSALARVRGDIIGPG